MLLIHLESLVQSYNLGALLIQIRFQASYAILRRTMTFLSLKCVQPNSFNNAYSLYLQLDNKIVIISISNESYK